MPIVEPLGAYDYAYDVAPDGQRILAMTPAPNGEGPALLTVIVNWEHELKK